MREPALFHGTSSAKRGSFFVSTSNHIRYESKNCIVRHLLVFFPLSTVAARTHGTQSRRDSIKVSRTAEGHLLHNKAVEAIKNKSFVLKAERMSWRNSRTEGCNPLTHFILFDGDKVIVQLSDHHSSKSTGSDYRVSTNKKGETIIDVKLSHGGVSRRLKLTLKKDSNDCVAKIDWLGYSRSITRYVMGCLFPLEEADIYIGYDWLGNF